VLEGVFMKVVVDYDACSSNAVCMGIAPEIFEVRAGLEHAVAFRFTFEQGVLILHRHEGQAVTGRRLRFV